MPDKATSAAKVSQVLDEIGLGTDGDITVNEMLSLAQTMTNSLSSVYRAVDASIQREFREIASYIEAMKTDIAGLQANDLKHTHLPTAGKELDAVVEATEEATNTIMECAEAIMCADDSDHDAYKAVVDENVMKIFEACSFQDITGQRITKVVETLTMIDERVSRFAHKFKVEDAEGYVTEDEAKRAKRKKDLLLDGPQAKGEGVSQDEVDDLFSAA
jgi:chemotaxis protein CheZ